MHKYIVYRGISIDRKNFKQKKIYNDLHNLQPNDIYSFDSFLSCSLMNMISFNFSKTSFVTNDNLSTCCILKINIPKGSKILYMDMEKNIYGSSKKPENTIFLWSEYEFLLPRAAILKFKDSFNISGFIPDIAPRSVFKNNHKITDLKILEFDFVGIKKIEKK